MYIKSRACAVMQPTYLPWLGYFDLIVNVNDFHFLDDVKFNKSSYHHQNKILSSNGDIFLSVPTHAIKGRMNSMIKDVKIDKSKNWKKKQLKSIEQSYRKAPYFNNIFDKVESVLLSDIDKLSKLNIMLIKLFSSMLNVKTNFHLTSQMKNLTDNKVQRLLDICQSRECNYYYSPKGSLDYLDTVENKALFEEFGISIYFQEFKMIPYQQNQKEFVPYMSILDALMYCGAEGTRDLIQKGGYMSRLT